MGEIHTVGRLEELPSPVPEATFVVVDVIICSTAIIRLLEAGASYVKPFRNTKSAQRFRRETDDALIVGEENDGERSDNFDFPPVPSIIDDRELAGRPVGIRTSNGTRAIERIGVQNDLYIGSTVNASAVGELLRSEDGDLWIVAAGRNGSEVGEDLVATERIRQQISDESATAWDRHRWLDTLDSSPSTEWLRTN